MITPIGILIHRLIVQSNLYKSRNQCNPKYQIGVITYL